MLELVKSPSMQVLSRGRLGLGLALSLVFAALLFAKCVQAQEPNAPDGVAAMPTGETQTTSGTAETAPVAVEPAAPAGEAPTAEQAPYTPAPAPPAAEETPTSDEPAPAAVEPEPAGPEATPPAEHAAPAEETQPAVEQAPPAVEETPAPAESPAVEAPPPAESPAEEAPPPIEQAPPVAEEHPPVLEPAPLVTEEAASVVEKKTPEPTTGETSVEASSEAPRGPGEDSQGTSGTPVATHREATGQAVPEASIAVTTSVIPTVAPEISASPVPGRTHLALRRQAGSARRAVQMSCASVSMAAGSVGLGWLSISFASPASNAFLAAASPSSRAIAAGAPTGSLGGGSATVNRPSGPGSGSGGSGGGSASGGGSGSASSASSTLVDVLRQAAPRAMRRLRLAQPSWRTSFFVLIPERPD